MKKSYKVFLLVQEMSEAEEQWESVGEPLELARFETLEEAKIFQNELIFP
jgi:hypothetical protein